jgi:hypothetical protein
MKISESLNQFEFHDAAIDGVVYSDETQSLEITVEFSEWVEGLENRVGQLVFHGVEGLKSEPNFSTVDWDERVFGDVVEFRHFPELDREVREGVRISMVLTHYEEGTKGVLTLEFSATRFEWLPRVNS